MNRYKGAKSKRSRNLRSKGRVAITQFLQSFDDGQRVRIHIDTNNVRGRPTTLRFNRKHGVIQGKQGKAYRVQIKDGNKHKTIIVSNAHLVKV
ncbi:MAG: 50S ribosomal protein L21e [Candidatus Micrarchaeota archaeon]|nr:50S ribosomal protein L21e [Candidatus Micrarchaeota archaeon]